MNIVVFMTTGREASGAVAGASVLQRARHRRGDGGHQPQEPRAAEGDKEKGPHRRRDQGEEEGPGEATERAHQSRVHHQRMCEWLWTDTKFY